MIKRILMKNVSCLTISFLILQNITYSQNFVSTKNEAGAFPIVTSSQATAIYVDENDDWLVRKAASLLQSDLEMVTGKRPEIISTISSEKNVIIIGSLGKSSLIKELVKEKKLDVGDI